MGVMHDDQPTPADQTTQHRQRSGSACSVDAGVVGEVHGADDEACTYYFSLMNPWSARAVGRYGARHAPAAWREKIMGVSYIDRRFTGGAWYLPSKIFVFSIPACHPSWTKIAR